MEELNAIVTQLRELGSKDFQDRIATRSADAIRMQLLKTLEAGQTPDGVAWAPRKKDGGRVYKNAAQRIEVKAYGDLVRGVLRGPEVYGHFGWNTTEPRPMIPDLGNGIPANIAKAITDSARKVLEETLK